MAYDGESAPVPLGGMFSRAAVDGVAAFTDLSVDKDVVLTPYALHPTPYTLNPTPDTRHPTPYTLHPAPYTLHPTPCPYPYHYPYS